MDEQISKKDQKELARQEKLGREELGRKGKARRRFLVAALVIIGIGLSIWGLSKLSATNSGGSGALHEPVTDNDWSRGNKNAKVTLVEYSDFQCPACGAYYAVVKKIASDFSNSLRVVYRHFPLSQHQNARSAAAASEAAGAQGKFWEMHDILFERQAQWTLATDPKPIFLSYASELKLDPNKFSADLTSSWVSDKITAEQNGGIDSGVNATPTFFINGKPVTGLTTFDDLRNDVGQTISQAK